MRTPVAESLAAIAAVQEVHFVAGPDRFLVKLRVADAAELDLLLREAITPMPSRPLSGRFTSRGPPPLSGNTLDRYGAGH